MYPVRVPPPRLTAELHYDMEAAVAVVDGEKLSEITNNCTECVICLDGIGADEEGEIRVLLCGHRFHAACIDEWLIKYRSVCPTCRRPACGTIGILLEQCMLYGSPSAPLTPDEVAHSSSWSARVSPSFLAGLLLFQILSPLIHPQYYFQIIHTRMVELQPISTGTQSNSTTSSSNNSISSSSSCSSPTQPSPISLLPPPNFRIMRPPLLLHHLYSPSPLNPPPPYPLNHPHPHPHPHQAVYIQFPQQPYLVHPYFDHFCYYTNPLPPDYLPPHHHQPHADQYHFYPQPRTPPAGGPQHCVAVAYSSGGDGGGCDGGAEEVVDPALDHHYGGDRRRVAKWGRRVSSRFTSSGPRNFHGGQSNFGRCRVKKTWKPKEASSNSVASPSPATPMNCTTLMIKNIPNHISRRTLINLLESHCGDQNEIAEQQTHPCRSEFDFLYLPFDFKGKRDARSISRFQCSNVTQKSIYRCCSSRLAMDGTAVFPK
ncbi:hypothetical protein Cgig2_015581 [Carnegiea gigantea]|uniref:RING-type domain-containing protein n=1 Tax=Carnegiea gigantea TaxID=171969 RepID=A0A9Q1JG81_9CARY|nr:hypothetical protein Cgig2_015581 [Carnegiea gigantea]